jgi:hypothetical protein
MKFKNGFTIFFKEENIDKNTNGIAFHAQRGNLSCL